VEPVNPYILCTVLCYLTQQQGEDLPFFENQKYSEKAFTFKLLVGKRDMEKMLDAFKNSN
jgi:hypothetical protein